MGLAMLMMPLNNTEEQHLQSSIDVQQSLLTSCDGTIAKQINWLEDFTGTKNHNKAKTWPEMILEPFLRSYSAAVEASMAMISISYDIASNQLESYRKIIDLSDCIFLIVRLGGLSARSCLFIYTSIYPSIYLRFVFSEGYLQECKIKEYTIGSNSKFILF
jgi:hypothetical protein